MQPAEEESARKKAGAGVEDDAGAGAVVVWKELDAGATGAVVVWNGFDDAGADDGVTGKEEAGGADDCTGGL
uniref:Uncharacterized protein n=1 Tax=uncultured bacterium contig00042 TaxID=1181529 RepID=A0A806K050_9BACT|nr:hypothetical protein [uncultured bacterium contig00042]